MPDYGLDPSIVSYLQGVDPSMYQPSDATPPVVDYATATQQAPPAGYTAVSPADLTAQPAPLTQAPTAPASQPVDTGGLHPAVAAAIQNGFTLPPPISQSDIAPAHQPMGPDVTTTIFTPTDRQIDEGNYRYDQSQASQATPHLLPQYSSLGNTRPLGPGEWIGNPNGSWSNEITTTVQDKSLNGGKPTVIPTLWVVNGKPTMVSEDDATRLAAQSGLQFPAFKTMGQAEQFANQRESNWQNVKEGDTSSVPALWRPSAAQLAYQQSPMGLMDQSDALQRKAIEQQGQANTIATAGQTAANDATVAELKAHEARAAADEQAAEQQRAADAANVQKYTQQYAQQVQDAADYKVDTNRDVGMGGLIAIALSGIGNALDHYHGPNAAAQMIEEGITQRINDQWRQKDALEKKATGTASVINQFRAQSDDDRQAQALHTAAEFNQTADHLKLIAAQSQNPQVKANAQAAAAKLTQDSAAIIAGQAQRKAGAIAAAAAAKQQQFENAMKEQADATTRRGQTLDYNAKLLDHQDKQLDAQKAQEDAIAQRGWEVPTGGVVKLPDGSMIPERTAAVNQNGKPWVMSEDDARTFQPIRAGTDEAIRALDQVRQLRKDFGGASQAAAKIGTSEQGRAVLQEMSRTVLALEKTFGGATRMSPEFLKLIHNEATGGLDSDSMRSMMNELDRARKDIVDQLNDEAASRHYTGKPIDIPDPLKAPPAKLDRVDQLVQQANSKNDIEQHQYGIGVINAGPAVGTMGMVQGTLDRAAAVDKLVDVYRQSQDDAERAKAVSALRNLAATAPDDVTRQYAAKKLSEIPTGPDGSGVVLHNSRGF